MKRYCFVLHQESENFTVLNEIPLDVIEKIQDLIGDFIDDISIENHLIIREATAKEIEEAEINGEKY